MCTNEKITIALASKFHVFWTRIFDLQRVNESLTGQASSDILFRFMEEVSRFRSRCRKYLFALKTKDTERERISRTIGKIVGVHVRWGEEGKKKKRKRKERPSYSEYQIPIFDSFDHPRIRLRLAKPPSLKPFSTCLQHPHSSSYGVHARPCKR